MAPPLRAGTAVSTPSKTLSCAAGFSCQVTECGSGRDFDPSLERALRARRKVRGALPALSEAEMARYRSALYGLAASVGHVPRMSLGGRNRCQFRPPALADSCHACGGVQPCSTAGARRRGLPA